MNIPIFQPYLEGNEKAYLIRCIETGWISSQGNFVQSFEKAFAAFCGRKSGIATTSCTTALHLALVALGIRRGDEVICPALTFIAPANMIKLAGAIPVLVDSEWDTWNCDPLQIEQRITSRTRAIIVVHAFGHSAKMDEIMEIASRHNLYVIEDVAEAPGALYKGRQLGGIGHIACFSFFSNKIITTGEGGMIALDDASLKDRIEELRDHGMSKEKRYKHTHLGFNYRMTNMQAAVGLAQLEQLPKILALREQQQRKYESCLNHPEYLSFHPRFAACQPVHWMMTILLKRENIRDALVDYLRTKGIDSRQMIYPVHFARPYQRRYRGGSFPNAERISLNCLHLPSATGLKTEEIEYISACVMAFLRTRV